MTTPATPDAPAAIRGDLAHQLRAWDDARLNHLLTLRPDLAHPAPSSLTSMAARAGTRPSVGRALARLDAPSLLVAEAIAVMADGAATSVAALTQAMGADVSRWVQHLVDLALVMGSPEDLRPVPALVEALGPHPLGLGPHLGALPVNLTDGWPTTPRALAAVMAKAPEGAARMLDALTWGPPVGTVATDIPPAARWLLDVHILHRISGTQLVLPREVALAARGGRLVRDLPLAPVLAAAPERDAATIAAEGVRAAEEVLHAVAIVLDEWGAEPPAVLRSGGIGVRDLRQVATLVEGSPAHAALVAELAGMLGLIGQYHDVEGTAWAPTIEAEGWRELPLPTRWAAAVSAWLDSPRTPWLAGTRNEKGVLRSALEPDLERPWAPVLRRRVLDALREWPQHAAPGAGDVLDLLAWHTPRATPPLRAVEAILAEAATLGLVGAGALTPPAQLLLDGADPERLAAALSEQLPPAVAELFVQGDLTGIVPGRPTPALATLLESSAQVESRGAALSVRFTNASIRRALDTGMTSETLLERLREFSRTPLPQPLEYMVADTARKHGQVRVGSADAFLRSEDTSALAALAGDPRLRALGLRLIAPTVLIAQAGGHEVVEALRAIGTSPVLEGPDGELLVLAARTTRAVRPVAGGNGAGPLAPEPELAEVIAAMRTGEARAQELLRERGGRPSDATDPVHALEMLRLAAAQGATVQLLVTGPSGKTERRLVRPLSIEGGRVRVLDTKRGAEITVAVHRIAAVHPLTPS